MHIIIIFTCEIKFYGLYFKRSRARVSFGFFFLFILCVSVVLDSTDAKRDQLKIHKYNSHVMEKWKIHSAVSTRAERMNKQREKNTPKSKRIEAQK